MLEALYFKKLIFFVIVQWLLVSPALKRGWIF